MTKIGETLDLLVRDVEDRTRFRISVMTIYDGLTSAKSASEFAIADASKHLKTIRMLLEHVHNHDVLQDEEFWYAYLRILEIFASDIYVTLISNDSTTLLNLLPLLHQLAKAFHHRYGYFPTHDFALSRFAEYSNFAEQVEQARAIPQLDPHKLDDVNIGLQQNYLLVPHLSHDAQTVSNDGYLGVQIEQDIIRPNKKLALPNTATTAKVIGFDLRLPVYPAAEVLPLNFDGIFRAIEQWRPSQRWRHEEGYHAELAEHLRHRFPGVAVEQGTSKADIEIANIAIECKKSPSGTELDRLEGQIKKQKIEFGNVIVVICDVKANDQYLKWKETHSADAQVRILEK